MLRSLIEHDDTTRGTAIFALGYWAGCRVSDVAHLEHDHIHITTKAGSITVGHKAGKQRTIDLHNEGRRPLYDYIRLRNGWKTSMCDAGWQSWWPFSSRVPPRSPTTRWRCTIAS